MPEICWAEHIFLGLEEGYELNHAPQKVYGGPRYLTI